MITKEHNNRGGPNLKQYCQPGPVSGNCNTAGIQYNFPYSFPDRAKGFELVAADFCCQNNKDNAASSGEHRQILERLSFQMPFL